MSVALTWTFNLSGHPAVSIPAGFTGRGEPVGLQLVARHGQEALLLAVALAAEGRPPACQAPRTDARAASALTEVSGSYGR
jgi:Asp-tRNA(Asn)/Glu-tRNA(Gln) amidotransferase A subunit family amidase